jgi:hypothetical protein
MPETIGALSLEDPDAFPTEFREAARTAALYLTQRGRRPDLAFAQVSKHSSGQIAVHVWPASMFGHAKPRGGGGVTLLFDPRTHRIEKSLGWQ